MASPDPTMLLLVGLSALLVIALLLALSQWRGRVRASRRISLFNRELHEVAADASVGRRLPVPEDGDAAT